jgi:hypothetical protein
MDKKKMILGKQNDCIVIIMSHFNKKTPFDSIHEPKGISIIFQ